MQWQRITVSTTSEYADILAVLLNEMGSEGVSICDNKDIEILRSSELYWDYIEDALLSNGDKNVYVSGFFPPDFSIAALQERLQAYRAISEVPTGSLDVKSEVLCSEDWENVWKQFYEPIEMERFMIVPEWIRNVHTKKKKVFLDPGMAFGTGKHESTSMCLQLLENVSDLGYVLDIGCGSGILGISAKVLGAKHCLLTDIDPIAVQSARRNSELNDLDSTCVILQCDGIPGQLPQPADLVLANITVDILIRLQDDLVRAIRVGGALIMGGIIRARAGELEQAYTDRFDFVCKKEEGEWCAYLLTKKDISP